MNSQTYRLSIEVVTESAKNQLNNLKKALQDLERGSTDASRDLDNLSKDIKDTANESSKAKNKQKEFAKSLNDTEKNARGLSSTMSSLHGTLKGVLGVLGVSMGIGSIIQTADSMQVLNDQVRLATGTAEKYGVAMQNIERIAMSNRVSLQSVGEMYVSNERALKQLGKSQEEVISFTENVTKAMRVGGGSAEAQAAALTQLGQALASGVLRGDEFNSIAEQAPMIMELMADSLNVTTGELRKMAGEGKLTAEAVYQALTSAEASQKLGAMTGQTATTVTGALQVVKNQWDIAVNKFMNGENGISQALANIIIKISDIIPKVVEFGQAFAESEAWQLGIAGLGTVFEIAKIAIDNTVEALTPIGDFITNHSDLVLALSAGLLAGATAYGAIALVMGAFATAGGIATAITTGLTAVTGALAGAMAILTSPITLTAIAIGVLVAAGVALYRNWDEVKAKAEEIWFAIGEIVANMVDNVTEKWEGLKSKVSTAADSMSATARTKFNELKTTAQTVFQSLPAPVQTALRVMGNIFNTQFALIKNVVQTVFNTIKALVRGDMEGVKTAISNGIQNAWNIVKTGVGNIAKEFLGLGSKLKQAGTDAIQGLIDGISSRFNAVRAKVSEIAGLIPEGVRRLLDIRSPSRVMREIGAWAGEGFVLGAGDKVKDAEQVANDLANALTSTIKDLHRQNFMLTHHANPLAEWDYKLQFGELAELTAAQKARVMELAQANHKLSITNANNEAINKKIAEINEKILLVGKSELEILQYQLDHAKEYQGVSDEIKQTYLDRTRALQDEIKANERLNALQKARDDFAKQQFISQNPTDKYAGQRFDLQKQGFDGGQIDEMVGYQAKMDAFSAFQNLQNTLRQNLPKDPMAQLQAQFDQNLEIIRKGRESQLGIHAEFDQAEIELSRQFLQAKNELMLSQSADLLGSMTKIAKTAFGEQSKAYRMIFAMEKGMAIARSVMAIQTALAQASASAPFPANLGVMATVASQVANIVGNIKAVAMPIGQAHDGIMSVPKSGTWNLEKGERVLPKHTAKALDDKLNTMGGGGQTIIVNVTVNSDGTATVDSQAQMGKQMGEAIKVAVQQEFIKQQRQGGVLYGR